MTTFANGESGLSVRTKINNVLQHADGTAGELVINEAGADVDFRVESDTNANALFVDGATGNVGIGLSSSGDKLDVNGTSFFRGNMGVFSPTGGAVTSSMLTFGSAALINAARIFSNTESSTAGSLVFQTAQTGTGTMTNRLRLTADGDVNVLNGNLVIGTSGKGIDFSATSGTGTSELFDDYEEGTWTPVVAGLTTAGTYELQKAVGKYTKVGDLVTIEALIQLAAAVTGGGAGSLGITGVPFAKPADAYSAAAAYVAFVTISETPIVTWSSFEASSTLLLQQNASGGYGTSVAITDVTNNSYISFSLTYKVA